MLTKVRAVPGDVGFYYKDLTTGQVASYGAERPLIAASIIKLPIMAEAFRQFEKGLLDPDRRIALHGADKVPPCGVLTLMDEGLMPTVRDLVMLMIVISDNTATNMLIDLTGMENVNALLDTLGMPDTRLRRKMFDRERSRRGIQNTVTAADMAGLLEMIYRGEMVSLAASKAMLELLINQQLNGKIPFRLKDDIPIAHKTGEDEGITHDVGIILSEKPFILCFLGNGVDTQSYERVMQDMAWELVYA